MSVSLIAALIVASGCSGGTQAPPSPGEAPTTSGRSARDAQEGEEAEELYEESGGELTGDPREAPASDPAPAKETLPEKARCNRAAPFGVPKVVPVVNTAAPERAARLSADELTMFFSRSAAGTDILVATRTQPTAPWSVGPVIAALSDGETDGSPSVTADGLTMFLHSNRTGTAGELDVWVARRMSKFAAWGTPSRIAAVSTASRDFDPYVRPDGKSLVFASNRAGNADLYVSTIDAGKTSAPRAIAELNTPAEETNPVLSADGLAIYFARSAASQDIFVARRANVADKFGAATLVTELSTPKDERPTWISADECVIYLSADPTVGTAGASEVLVAERPTE